MKALIASIFLCYAATCATQVSAAPKVPDRQQGPHKFGGRSGDFRNTLGNAPDRPAEPSPKPPPDSIMGTPKPTGPGNTPQTQDALADFGKSVSDHETDTKQDDSTGKQGNATAPGSHHLTETRSCRDRADLGTESPIGGAAGNPDCAQEKKVSARPGAQAPSKRVVSVHSH